MKRRAILLAGLTSCLLILTLACTPAGEKPRSTHIDSSNVHGTAPVNYEGDDPTDTTSRYPAGDDTGRRENTEGERE